MSNALTEINSLNGYQAPSHRRSQVSGFQIYLIAVVALAMSAFLFALLP